MSAPNQAELARRAGVSQATVSRCLRNDPSQNPATRELVLKIASEMGYVPNSFAAGLARQRTTAESARANLAVIGGNLENPVVAYENWKAFLEAARGQAEKQGYALDYFWRYAEGTTAAKLSRMIKARGIVGVILLMISPEELDLPWEHLALCSACCNPHHPPRTHYVASNVYHETCQVLRECAKLGYKRPGLVINYSADERSTEGAVTGAFLFHLQGLPAKQRVPLYTEDSDHSRSPRFMAWYEKYRPDLILAMHGGYAKRLADRIPDELGFVNLSGSDYGMLPGFSYVGCRTDLAGIAAVDVVIAHLNRHERGWPEYPRCIVVPSQWTPGSTTRQVRPT